MTARASRALRYMAKELGDPWSQRWPGDAAWLGKDVTVADLERKLVRECLQDHRSGAVDPRNSELWAQKVVN